MRSSDNDNWYMYYDGRPKQGLLRRLWNWIRHKRKRAEILLPDGKWHEVEFLSETEARIKKVELATHKEATDG